MNIRLKGRPKRAYAGIIKRKMQALYIKLYKKQEKIRLDLKRREEIKQIIKELGKEEALKPNIVKLLPDTYKEECKNCEDKPRRHASAYCQECSDKAKALLGTSK